MPDLFSSSRRRLVAKGLMSAFGLTLSGLFVSDLVWKTPLRLKVFLGILLLILFLSAWLICPPKEVKEEEA